MKTPRTIVAALVVAAACSSRDAGESIGGQALPAISDTPCYDDSCALPAVLRHVGVSEPEGIEVQEPGPERPCNGVDEDGDGKDECGPDADGDGAPVPLDCDDSNPRIRPHEPEIWCDGIDQSCDGIDDCDSDYDGWLDRIDCEPKDPAITDECWTPPDLKQTSTK